MTLGASYATTTQLKTYLKITDTVDDTLLSDALSTASRQIEKICNRQFNDAGSASARVYYPRSSYCVKVDDFSTVTGLVVKADTGDTGTFNQTWTTSDYQVEPLNGIVDGETGWPYYEITAVNNLWFLTFTRRPSVQITAECGWTAFPAGVKLVCVILAEEVYKLKGAPFGVATFDQFGPIRVKDNPKVMGWLAKYIREPVMVA